MYLVKVLPPKGQISIILTLLGLNGFVAQSYS